MSSPTEAMCKEDCKLQQKELYDQLKLQIEQVCTLNKELRDNNTKLSYD
jgi:hypothetical protein